MSQKPEISILVLTYNRRQLLERNLNSIFKQTFNNYEILLLDDASIDDTQKYIESLTDSRIRYYRNEKNLGKKYGDWWAIHKAIHHLAQGKYFIYLCDDDYWFSKDLLENLIDKHYKYPNLSLSFGGQAFIFDHNPPSGYIPIENLKGGYKAKELFPEGYMEGWDYLTLYSENPCGKNYLEGSSLFSIKSLKESGAFKEKKGTKWQAGYMFKMGPAVVGDVFFTEKAYVVTGVDGRNESFKRTQVLHFWDIVDSIGDSFKGIKSSVFYESLKKEDKERIKVIYTNTFNNFCIRWYKDQLRYKFGKMHYLVTKEYFLERLTLKMLLVASKRVGCWIKFYTFFIALLSSILPKKILSIKGVSRWIKVLLLYVQL